MSELTAQVKAIFGQALAIEAVEDRVAFLEKSCGNDESLKNEVASLLLAFDRAGNFMKQPSVSISLPTLEPGRPVEAAGSLIGPYKLLQQIGEGGFGVVYMAEQESPVRRMVALKIIKPGMDTAQVIARFESERQALALMDHPNIAKVFDAGTTDAGRPYFVMELVKGVPITEFCDKNHMPPGQRLKLFIDVCHAIQHAHHKGVIHRDIKPSNVMVTLHDGVPVVKVIDFGVAKATMQKLTEKTLFTSYGQMIGSPAYMSPEQAEMSGLDIDTRSDVYSLGVMLYELLTGTTPLENRRLREAGYAEMQRLICQEEAPRPSNRLSSLGDSATVTAGNRGLDVKHLINFITGDLDWVVMKALEKDRRRRYDTPGSLAEDVGRYLGHEPILARPPSAVYRMKKFGQRNRAAVVAAGVMASSLLAGLAASTWQAVRASRAEDAALAALGEKETARAAEARERVRTLQNAQKAEAAAQAEKQARLAALELEAQTRAALEFVEQKVFAAARPEGQAGGLGREVTLRQALEAGVPFVEQRFKGQPLVEARLRQTLAISFFYLGDFQQAAAQCEAAHALYRKHRGADHPHTLACANDLGNCYERAGRRADALKLLEETLPIQQKKLGLDHEQTLITMNNLAGSYQLAGRYLDAMALLETAFEQMKVRHGLDDPKTLDAMANLASSYDALGGAAEALRLRKQVLLLRKARLGPDHPDTLSAMHHVAASYFKLRRYAEALKLSEETLALQKTKLGPDHPDTLLTLQAVAQCLIELGRHTDAAKLCEQTLTTVTQKLGPEHPQTLLCMQKLGICYDRLRRYADALKLHQEVLAVMKKNFAPNDPDIVRAKWAVADEFERLNRTDEALALIDDCLRHAGNAAVDAEVVPEVMQLRLRLFVHKKDVSGCRQTAEMWENLHRDGAESLYTAARMRAIVAGVIKGASGDSAAASAEANAELDRAMNWLTQAVAAGFTDMTELKRAKELNALRDREEFKKLFAEMTKRTTKAE
jgi:serine/threonine protein kinase